MADEDHEIGRSARSGATGRSSLAPFILGLQQMQMLEYSYERRRHHQAIAGTDRARVAAALTGTDCPSAAQRYLDAAFTNNLEDEANNQKHSDRMEGYMKLALHQYNSKEELVEDLRFEFERVQSQNWIVEGEFLNPCYYHFNFTAKQACSSVFTFFAEVTPKDGDDCDVLCCKLLNDDDKGHCFGCENEGVDDLRHPACESTYVGGHEDRGPMESSENMDDVD